MTGQQTKLLISPNTASCKDCDEARFIQPRSRGYKSLNRVAADQLALALKGHGPGPGDALRD